MKLGATSAAALLAASAAGSPFDFGPMGMMGGGMMGGGMMPHHHHHHHPGEMGGMMNPMMGGMMPHHHHHHMGEGMMMGGGMGPFMSPMMGGGPFGMYRRRLDAFPDAPEPQCGDREVPGGLQQPHQSQKPADADRPRPPASLATLRDRCCALCPAGGVGCLARCSKECANLDECAAAGRGAYAAVCQRGCFKFPLIEPSERAFQPSTACEETCVKVTAESCQASNNCQLDFGCSIDQCEAAAREMCATDRLRDYLRRKGIA